MKQLIKASALLGAIIGAAYGLLLAIPFIQALACLTYIFIGGAIVFFLKRNSFVGILSLQDGALVGAISGFCAMIVSSAVYLPIFALFNLIFNLKTGIGFFSSFWVTSYSLIVIPMIIFFMGLLSALFNAFTGLAVAFVYEKIENNPVEESGFIIDQK